jgi:hypothetical protein
LAHAPKALVAVRQTRKQAPRKNGPRSLTRARSIAGHFLQWQKSWRQIASFVFAVRFEPVLIVSRAHVQEMVDANAETPKKQHSVCSVEQPLIEDRCNLHSFDFVHLVPSISKAFTSKHLIHSPASTSYLNFKLQGNFQYTRAFFLCWAKLFV